MMGKVSNESPTSNVYSNIFIHPFFWAGAPKGAMNYGHVAFFLFDSFSSFLHPFLSPKTLPAATNALPPTSVVLPAAFEVLLGWESSKACSATLEAFAVTS